MGIFIGSNRLLEKLRKIREIIIDTKNELYPLENINNRVNGIESKIDIMMKDLDFLKSTIIRKNQNEDFVFESSICGIPLKFSDALTSFTVPGVLMEMKRSEYNFSEIDFKPGDCVIDIGANVDIISIFLAKKYPFLKIYAYEPMKRNYENFIKNISLNNIHPETIIVENKAVTKDERIISMQFNPYNTGGSHVCDIIAAPNNLTNIETNISSISLDNIFNKYNIKNCKLLKIDCEGAEYEILYNTSIRNLHKISHLRGEFHEKKSIDSLSRADNLLQYVKNYIRNVDISILKEFI